MTEKRFTSKVVDWWHDVDKVRVVFDKGEWIDADNCAKLLNELHEENEQLKSTIKEVTELLSEEVDLFSDKATEHDINAYVELKELDNKDAYYMATSTKKAIRMLRELIE